MILITFFLSLTGRFPAHKKLARYTFPIWLYVSVTGVIVYVMLAAYLSLMPACYSHSLITCPYAA